MAAGISCYSSDCKTLRKCSKTTPTLLDICEQSTRIIKNLSQYKNYSTYLGLFSRQHAEETTHSNRIWEDREEGFRSSGALALSTTDEDVRPSVAMTSTSSTLLGPGLSTAAVKEIGPCGDAAPVLGDSNAQITQLVLRTFIVNNLRLFDSALANKGFYGSGQFGEIQQTRRDGGQQCQGIDCPGRGGSLPRPAVV